MSESKGNPDQPFSAWYRNHAGLVQWRIILPIEVWYGSTEWHKSEQWFLKAFDPQKGELRDFALSDFLGDRWDASEQVQNGDFKAALEDEFKALTARANALGYQLVSDEQAEALGASLTVGNGLVVHGSIEALGRVQQYILLPSKHPVEDADVKRGLARDLQAAEALLAAAHLRIAELSAMLVEKG